MELLKLLGAFFIIGFIAHSCSNDSSDNSSSTAASSSVSRVKSQEKLSRRTSPVENRCMQDLKQCLFQATECLQKNDVIGAINRYKIVCREGRGKACTSLSYIYLLSKYQRRDIDLAAKYAKLACSANDGNGCFLYAKALEQGQGVDMDYESAADAYAKACRLGYKLACKKAEKTTRD